MPQVLESLESPDLLAALDANMVAYWVPYGRGEGCTLQDTAEATWIYTGVPHPLFNCVIRAQFGRADDVEHARSAVQQRIRERGAPALWWVGPLSQPADLGAVLERSGLSAAGQAPGMAIDLAALSVDQPIAGFTMQRVDGAAMQAEWARVAGVGTEFPPAAIDALERVEASLADPQYRAQHRYIGLLDGVAVASSALVLEAGVAGIYAVATVPAARGKGIGRAMTALPFVDARTLGYRVCVLQASTMGYPIYARMGFRDVCDYRLFLQS